MRPMSNIQIYDSSGSLRYPDREGEISEEKKEHIRDLFFNNIYIKSHDNEITLFFNASTGTPEQFIAKISTHRWDDPLQRAFEELKKLVEKDLGWSFADSSVSKGQQALMSISSGDPTEIEKYPLDTLHDVASVRTIDIGTPDIQSAVNVGRWLISRGSQELSVAIAGDGRTKFLLETDVVIVPNATESDITGINGSDQLLKDTFIESAVDNTLKTIHSATPHPDNQDYTIRQQTVVTLLEWMINSFELTDYLVEPTSTIKENQNRDMKIGGIAASILAFVGAFIFFGGLSEIGSWIENDIIAGQRYEFATLTTIDPLIEWLEVTSPPNEATLAVSTLLVTGWLLVGGVLGYRVRGMNSYKNKDGRDPSIHQQNFNQIQNIMQQIKQTPEVTRNQFAEELSARSKDIPCNVSFLSKSVEKRNRLLMAGGVSLLTAIGGGLVGYGLAEFIDNILQYWGQIAEFLILVSGLAVIVALIGFVVKEFF